MSTFVYRAAFVFLCALLCAPTAHAATITIVNGDSAGEGFNDPTPVSPEGGNAGTTRGQQRLNVFNAAAAIWGARLQSSQNIKVFAQFNSFPGQCNSSGGVLGFAGPTNFRTNFAGAPNANTWYPDPLAEAIAGSNLNGASNEIEAEFNSDVDTGCLGSGSRFWYGTTQASPSGNLIALLPTVLHEMGHGLGFLTLVCTDTGGCGSDPFGGLALNTPDIWTFFLANAGNPSLKWKDMSNAQRAASITGDPNTVWTGANVTAGIPTFLPGGQGVQSGFVRMFAPNPVQLGSSVSHFSSAASPNLLMEPAINTNLFNQLDLTPALMQDIGWTLIGTVNQAPTISAPSGISVAEDTPSSLAGISFADVDAGAGNLLATFGVPVGQGSLNASSGAGVTVGGTASARTLSGTLSALNNFIAAGNLTYTSAQDASGSVTLGVQINDNGNTGSGGALSANTNVTLQITATNDAPTVTAPGSISVTEDTASNIAGISFADIDAPGTANVTATFSVPSGQGTLTGQAMAGVTVQNPNANTLTVAGQLNTVNVYVANNNVRYTTAQNATSNVVLTAAINDGGATGAGGAQTGSANITLSVIAVNDTPVVNAPATIDVSVVATSNLLGISFADVDAGSATVTASFSIPASQGTLSATAGGGVTGGGSGSAISLQGTVANINAFIAAGNLRYTPQAGNPATVALSISLNDGGATGSGGARTGNGSNTLQLTNLFANGFE